MTNYYKAVDQDGLSFFPIQRAKRINWINLVGISYEMENQEAWEEAVKAMRKGETHVCTEHLIHGYENIELARDFGERHKGKGSYRIVEFTGVPVAQLEGAMVLDRIAFDGEDQSQRNAAQESYEERFPNPVKYGFRSVEVLGEVDAFSH